MKSLINIYQLSYRWYNIISDYIERSTVVMGLDFM